MDPHTVRNAMLMEPVELWRAVRKDASYVVRHCRALAGVSHSGAVRVRLAQLAEYAELVAAQASETPIQFAGKLD
jgi:hypothetical protein